MTHTYIKHHPHRSLIRVNLPWFKLLPLAFILPLFIILYSLFIMSSFRSFPTPSFHRQLFSPWEFSGTVKGADITVSMGKTSTESKVEVERNGSKLEFTLPLNNSSIKQDKNAVVYSTPENNIELRYSLIEKGVKEEIILNTKPKTSSLLVPLKLTDLTVSRNPDGILMFYDPSGAYQFHFVSPYATDANGKKTRNIKYSIKPNDSSETSSYLLTIDLDSEFLSDPQTKYPVIVDPTISHDACWGISGACDAECTKSSYNSLTVYTTCSASSCNCYRWRQSGGGAPTGYTDGKIAYYYSEGSCAGSLLGYGLHGSLCVNTSTTNCQYASYTCYEGGLGSSQNVYSYNYFGVNPCYSASPIWVHTNIPTALTCMYGLYCTQYTTSGAVTRYYASGSCSSDGSGNCYKLTTQVSYYTGSSACPGTACSSGSYYDTVSTCTWIPAFHAPSTCTYEATPSISQITINWNDPNTAEDGYYIEKSTDGGAFANLTTTAASVVSYPDSSVSVGHTYQYRVRATLGSDYSEWCTTSIGNFQIGSFKFEGVKMEGLKID